MKLININFDLIKKIFDLFLLCLYFHIEFPEKDNHFSIKISSNEQKIVDVKTYTILAHFHRISWQCRTRKLNFRNIRIHPTLKCIQTTFSAKTVERESSHTVISFIWPSARRAALNINRFSRLPAKDQRTAHVRYIFSYYMCDVKRANSMPFWKQTRLEMHRGMVAFENASEDRCIFSFV